MIVWHMGMGMADAARPFEQEDPVALTRRLPISCIDAERSIHTVRCATAPERMAVMVTVMTMMVTDAGLFLLHCWVSRVTSHVRAAVVHVASSLSIR